MFENFLFAIEVTAPAYGEGVMALASVYLAILTILFNVLSVITSKQPLTHGNRYRLPPA